MEAGREGESIDPGEGAEAKGLRLCGGCGEQVVGVVDICTVCGRSLSDAAFRESEPGLLRRASSFWLRFFVVALLLVFLDQLALLVSTFLHEVVGHCGASWLVGGLSAGFQIRPDGGGLAWVSAPLDGPAWKQMLVDAGGFLATFAFGFACLWMARFTRARFVGRLVWLLLAYHAFELEYIVYDVWLELPSGDPGNVLHAVGRPWLTPLIFLLSASLLLWKVAWLHLLILETTESWIARGKALGSLARGTLILLVLVFVDLWRAALPAHPDGYHLTLDFFTWRIYCLVGVAVFVFLFLRKSRLVELAPERLRVRDVLPRLSGIALLAILGTLAAAMTSESGIFWTSPQLLMAATSKPAGQLDALHLAPSSDRAVVQEVLASQVSEWTLRSWILFEPGTGKARRVHPPPGREFCDDAIWWAPDSKRFATTLVDLPRRGTPRSSAWVYTYSSAEWREITKAGDWLCGGFSHDGRELLAYDLQLYGLARLDVATGRGEYLLVGPAMRALDLRASSVLPGAADWSGTGREVYFAKSGVWAEPTQGIWSLETAGGAPRRILSGYLPESVYVSPGQGHIAFLQRVPSSRHVDLFLYSIRDHQVRSLARDIDLLSQDWSMHSERLLWLERSGRVTITTPTGAPERLEELEGVRGIAWYGPQDELLWSDGKKLWRSTPRESERVPVELVGVETGAR